MRYLILIVAVTLSACKPHGPLSSDPAAISYYVTSYVGMSILCSVWFWLLGYNLQKQFPSCIKNSALKIISFAICWPITFPISVVAFVVFAMYTVITTSIEIANYLHGTYKQ